MPQIAHYTRALQTLSAMAIAAVVAAVLPAMAALKPHTLPEPIPACADGIEIVEPSGIARIGCTTDTAARSCNNPQAGDRVVLGAACQVEPDGMRAAWMVLWGLPLDITHRSAADLAHIPNLGPAMAERIVSHRTTHGPFARLDDITQVRGLGRKTLQKLAPHLKAGA